MPVHSFPKPQTPVTLPRSSRAWRPRRLRPICGPVVQTLDLLVLGATYLLILLARPGAHLRGVLQLSISLQVLLVAALCVATWRVILLSVGWYTPSRARSMTDYLLRLVIGLNSCTLVFGLIEVVLHAPGDVWHLSFVFWTVALAGMALLRGAALLGWHVVARLKNRPRTVLIVGSGQRARDTAAALEAHTEIDYRLLGFIDSEPQGDFVPAGMVLGGIDDLQRILTETAADEVMIALPMKSQYESVGYAIAVCQMLGVQSQYFTDYFAAGADPHAPVRSGRVSLQLETPTPLVARRFTTMRRWRLQILRFAQRVRSQKARHPGPR